MNTCAWCSSSPSGSSYIPPASLGLVVFTLKKLPYLKYESLILLLALLSSSTILMALFDLAPSLTYNNSWPPSLPFFLLTSDRCARLLCPLGLMP